MVWRVTSGKPPTPLPAAEIFDTGTVKYIVFQNRDLIGELVRRDGVYEPALIKVAQLLLKPQPPGVVLDIGANIGTFVLPLAKSFPAHRFECFEPQRIVYYQLCGNVVLNALPNVRTHHFGLSDSPARLDLVHPDYRTELNVAAFSLDDEVRKNQYECASVGETESIATQTLDSLGFGDVRLIKIDVEGMEQKVLMGGRATLAANNFPPIIFETWTWKPWYQQRRTELFTWLTHLGYGIFELENNNIAQHPAYGFSIKFKRKDGPPAEPNAAS